ncbi:hypothetical protein H632_c1624p0, partial [Helicosporidium sp. ATCC 50920]
MCRDERNLEENEIIKKELNPQKINEPKTPYLSPIDTDDEFDVESMSPLRLDDGPSPMGSSPAAGSTTSVQPGAAERDGRRPPASGKGAASAWEAHVESEARMRAENGSGGEQLGRADRPSGAAGGQPLTGSLKGSTPKAGLCGTHSPRFVEADFSHDADAVDENASPERKEKRRKFKAARREHYDMKAMLQ